MTSQIVFPFAAADPPPARLSRTTLYWRRKLAMTAAYSLELGKRRAAKRAIPKPPRSLSAAVVPQNVSREMFLSPADRTELAQLAKRIDRLSISRIDPEKFFADRSELAAELRRLARRY